MFTFLKMDTVKLIPVDYERSYNDEFVQVISDMNRLLSSRDMELIENTPDASTLMGYDDTYTVELYNKGVFVGTCTVVIDDFSIDGDDPRTILFVDYTSIETKGLGLSRIFVLFEVNLAILINAPIVSNDVSRIPGRYSGYGFQKIESELSYGDDEDDVDETDINNILTVDKLERARDVLEGKIFN